MCDKQLCNVQLLMTEFDGTDVTLCSWQDIEIQLLTKRSV